MPTPADFVLLVHFLFVLFVVGGLASIWLGAALGSPGLRRWVRNFWFRTAHLGATLFVAGESLLGMACPLTVWEDALRGQGAAATGFLQRWLHQILYYDLPAWVFTMAYIGFAALVVVTYRMLPPAPRA